MISGRTIQSQHADLFTFVCGDVDAVAMCCNVPEEASLESLVFATNAGHLVAARAHHPAILIVYGDAMAGVPSDDFGSCYFSVVSISRGMATLLKYFDRKSDRFAQVHHYPAAVAHSDAVVGDQMRMSSRLATVDAIKNTAHGEPVGPPIEIDASELSGEIEGMTARSYTPISERAATPGLFPNRVLK
jgi:hypothetical protein